MPIRCKLCGIRSEGDLEIAIRAGCDAVGFICGITHVSEDALSENEARDLARLTPPYVSTVLVTHLEAAPEILRLADFVGVDTIQVHGMVDVDVAAAVFAGAGGRRVTKAIHVTGPEAVAEAEAFLDACDALHLDSRTDNRLGGTGQLHDWSISRQIVKMASDRQGKPVVLSGGLRPEIVAEAIAAVKPFAVDVNSGIETPTGDKDASLATKFVAKAHAG